MINGNTDLESWANAWESGHTPWVHKDSEKFLIKAWSRLSSLGLKSERQVLIPLCGTSPSIRFFLSKKFHVSAVEYVQTAISALIKRDFPARRFRRTKISSGYCLKSPNLDIYQQDFFKFSPKGRFHLIYDRAALIAINPKLRKKYAKILLKSLKPGGIIFFVTFSRTGGRMRGAPYQITRSQLQKLFPSLNVVAALDKSTTKLSARFKNCGVKSISYSVTILQRAAK